MLLAIAVFFVVPLAWLVLAPTKTDFELPFAFFPFGVFLAYIYFATALPR